MNAAPIGVFDSGVGGLTVLRALRARLPNESWLYLGDIQNFPYGIRPSEDVRYLSVAITEYLRNLGAKLVVVACNTATAAALVTLRSRRLVPVVGVIEPGARAAVEATRGRVAVIATESTHRSRQYEQAIRRLRPDVSVISIPAPVLVRLVEAGLADTAMARNALAEVLVPAFASGCDTLVLGCTHFPLLGAALQDVLQGRMRIVDAAEATADDVVDVLRSKGIASSRTDRSGVLDLMVTGGEQEFTRSAVRLFGDVAPPRCVDVGAAVDPGHARLPWVGDLV